ncbi:signal peptidase I [Exiguobacterium flavidum]|uniref:signal peptidase I n=1 Tax=Exiguobacterium flavidum TaxID=2184695 RepID=UPI000DF77788|nr:signal peptidase I [Exiguobacterium flavidum]
MKELFSWIKALVVALVIAFIIRNFLFVPVSVDGESMMPTLQDRDRMIVNKVPYYFDEPERGDIIVFHATEERDYIKRVIAVPGDTVAYRDDVLYINDKKVDEPYLDPFKDEMEGLPLTNDFTLEEVTGETEVPEGKVFVLGDNRQNSKDSRMIGFIDESQIVGTTDVVFYPFDSIRMVD